MTFKDLKKIIADRTRDLEYNNDHNAGASDGSKFWKGKKIIPLKEWLKITNANNVSSRKDYNVRKGLQYFPDDYTKWMFPLGIEEEGQENLQKEEVNKWYSDYLELMKFRKNPSYGRKKCFGCLLSPDKADTSIFIGINKVVAKGLEEEGEGQGEGNSNNSATNRTIIYPCKVL